MKCPNCHNRDIEIYEASGFTSRESPVKECLCGHVWRVVPALYGKNRIDVIKQGNADRHPDQKLLHFNQNNRQVEDDNELTPTLPSLFDDL